MSDQRDAVDAGADSETASKADPDADSPPDADSNTATGSTSESETEPESTTEPVVERLEDVDKELAVVVRERLENLRAERDRERDRAEDLEKRLKRSQADFQNYKKRAKKRQESMKKRATEDLVERLLPVRDNLERALEQDSDADIRDGVESTLGELDRVLEDENVSLIEPEPGDEVDPQRHEVLMRVESDQPAETVAEQFRPGYTMAEAVLREAQVTVSDGSSSDGEDSSSGTDEGGSAAANGS